MEREMVQEKATLSELEGGQLDPIRSLEFLDQQRRAFSQLKTELLSRYLQSERSQKKSSTLLVLNGWGNYSDLFLDSKTGGVGRSESKLATQLATSSIAPLVNKRHDVSLEGGYFFTLKDRQTEQGIVINPGLGFLNRFHSEGGHLWDIHHVIVTNSNPLASHDLYEIYSLNKELNAQLRSYDLPPHVIRFYLHPDAFKTFAPILKPSLRQERGSVISLEIFQDSHGIEEISLSESITLAYAKPLDSHIPSSLAIKLISQGEGKEVRIGYLSQSGVHPDTVRFFTDCDIMIIGIGDVHFEEIAKLQKREECPGYVGSCELIKSLQEAKLVLLSEQSMLEGDIRLELVRQIRIDVASDSNQLPVILPSENGVEIDLMAATLSTKSASSSLGLAQIPLHHVRVVRQHGQFSCLTFIDQDSIL